MFCFFCIKAKEGIGSWPQEQGGFGSFDAAKEHVITPCKTLVAYGMLISEFTLIDKSVNSKVIIRRQNRSANQFVSTKLFVPKSYALSGQVGSS